MSQLLLRLPVVAAILVAAWATNVALLPLLFGLFVLTVLMEMLLAHLHGRWLVDELHSLARAADQPPPPSTPQLRVLGSLLWQTVADLIWAMADRLIVGPMLAARERRGDYNYQGRHHADRWARHEIDGTVAQRRPSAAAQQQLVERIVQADTGELPVIDDTDIHSWLDSHKLHQGAT